MILSFFFLLSPKIVLHLLFITMACSIAFALHFPLCIFPLRMTIEKLGSFGYRNSSKWQIASMANRSSDKWFMIWNKRYEECNIQWELIRSYRRDGWNRWEFAPNSITVNQQTHICRVAHKLTCRRVCQKNNIMTWHNIRIYVYSA